jgi:hypothetical protein
MKTFEEVSFDWTDLTNRAEHIGLVLGIDNVVQYLLHTYDNVYALLTSPHTFSDGAEGNPEGSYYVNVLLNEEVVETLQVPEIVWALLLSDCDVIKVAKYTETGKTYEEMGDLYYVEAGWRYSFSNGKHEILPPVGWASPVKKTLQEQHDYYVKLTEGLSNYIAKNPDLDEYYVEMLSSATSRKLTLEAQLGVENEKRKTR